MAASVGLIGPPGAITGPQGLCPWQRFHMTTLQQGLKNYFLFFFSFFFFCLWYVSPGLCLQATIVCKFLELPLRLDGSQRQSNLRGHNHFCSLSVLGGQLYFQSKMNTWAHLDLFPVKTRKSPAPEPPHLWSMNKASALLDLLLTLLPCRAYCRETIKAAQPPFIQVTASIKGNGQAYTNSQVCCSLNIPIQAGLYPFVLSLGWLVTVPLYRRQ